MSASVWGRALTILLTTLATIVGLAAFFLILLAFGAGNPSHAFIYGGVFLVCLWYVASVMRADRARRKAEEAGLPPERRPVRREPQRPITFRVRETFIAFAIWAAIAGVFGAASGLPAPVTVGGAVFGGFMLATITVTGRHMMFRITGDEEDD